MISLLDDDGHDKACMVAHSLGTTAVSWMLHHPEVTYDNAKLKQDFNIWLTDLRIDRLTDYTDDWSNLLSCFRFFSF